MDGTYGLAAIFRILLVKELGVPLPIPSDLLMIGAGAQAALGAYGLSELAIAVIVAVAVGVTTQFLLFRSFGRALLERAGAGLGLSSARRAAVEARLRAGGARAVFVGLNIPGARAVVVAVAGLAALPHASFARGDRGDARLPRRADRARIPGRTLGGRAGHRCRAAAPPRLRRTRRARRRSVAAALARVDASAD